MSSISIETRNRSYSENLPKQQKQVKKVFEAFLELRPCSLHDIARTTGLPMSTVTGRMNELKEEHVLIKEIGKRCDHITDGPNALLDLYPSTEDRMEAIFRKRNEIKSAIDNFIEDYQSGNTDDTKALVLDKVEKLRKKLKKIEEL